MTNLSETKQRKQAYFAKLIELLDKYPKLIIVGCDNVGSFHMQTIRKSLRGKATLLMGKNTMIRKAIKSHLNQNPQLEALIPHLKGNIGFVFTNEDLNDIKQHLLKEKVAAPAKAGAIAPCDVTIPAGPTGLDPSQTSFMQALNIATKINKGQVEIINPVNIIKKDQKVGQSEAALLQKLNINPFSYGLIPIQVYDSGFCFHPDILDIKDEDILSKFLFGVQNLAALSLASNVPTLAALPHYIGNAYQNLLAISIATDYTFDRSQQIKDLLADPEALAAATAAASAPAAAAPAAPAPAAEVKEAAPAKPAEPEKKEEEEDEEGGFGDLFG
jgi:large subunit ribosomal protein LP0